MEALLCDEVRQHRLAILTAIQPFTTADVMDCETNRPKLIGVRVEVRKAIQAAIFATLGFDIGFDACAEASDKVFEVLQADGISNGRSLRMVYRDPSKSSKPSLLELIQMLPKVPTERAAPSGESSQCSHHTTRRASGSLLLELGSRPSTCVT